MNLLLRLQRHKVRYYDWLRVNKSNLVYLALDINQSINQSVSPDR